MIWLAYQATLGALLALTTTALALATLYALTALLARTQAAWRLRTAIAVHRPRRRGR